MISASTIRVSAGQAMVTDQTGIHCVWLWNEFKIIYFAVTSVSTPTNNQGMVIDLTTSKL